MLYKSFPGLQHFGCEGGEYTVSSKITDATSGSCLVKTSGTYSCEKDTDHASYGFDVLFNSPVILQPKETYKIISKINGPGSRYGEQGLRFFQTAGVGFTIQLTLEMGPMRQEASFQACFSIFLVNHIFY